MNNIIIIIISKSIKENYKVLQNVANKLFK